MDKRKESNLRVKSSISAALLRLLNEKSISDITISEIIRSAGVARASFYRNYATKESVITTLIADILDDFRKMLQSDGDNFYTYENIRTSFDFFSRYERPLLDLYRFGYGSLLLIMLNEFHKTVAGSMPSHSIERYGLYMYIGSLYNTAMMWLVSGKKENIDEISRMFYNNCGFTGA